jgi:hypothetical protein
MCISVTLHSVHVAASEAIPASKCVVNCFQSFASSQVHDIARPEHHLQSVL